MAVRFVRELTNNGKKRMDANVGVCVRRLRNARAVKQKAFQMYKVSDEIDGWIITFIHNDYDVLYIIFALIRIFVPTSPRLLPDPPNITYTIRNKYTGAIRKVTLSGTHNQENLAAAVASLR